MQVCAINSGYWDTKVFDGRRQFKLRTKLDEGEGIINGSNTHQIVYEEKNYILGDGAEKYSLAYDKTSSLLHRLVTYYALARLTESRDEYRIMVALPLNIYSTLKEQFQSYLKTKDYFPLTVDGVRKYIHIADCRTFPEGPAALYANEPQRYREDIVGILDIGSLTVNGCVMHNLNLVRESVFTINAGSIILYSKLRKELNNKYLLNLQEYEMPGIIKHGLKVNGTSREVEGIVREVITFHLQEIILEMRKSNWPVESIKILLTGGGSLLLEEHIKQLLPGAFLGQDCIYDNVRGLYEIAKVVYAS
jgi:plasmid segregation protein ParM